MGAGDPSGAASRDSINVSPRAGWWALTAIPETNKTTRNPEGKKVKAELGGGFWIRCMDKE